MTWLLRTRRPLAETARQRGGGDDKGKRKVKSGGVENGGKMRLIPAGGYVNCALSEEEGKRGDVGAGEKRDFVYKAIRRSVGSGKVLGKGDGWVKGGWSVLIRKREESYSNAWEEELMRGEKGERQRSRKGETELWVRGGRRFKNNE